MKPIELAGALRAIAADNDLMTAAHLAVEDVLVEMRDMRAGIIGPANGFVIHEKDGALSDVMRLGTRDGLVIAIKAIADHLEQP